jgi:glycosyltransferase involved in cell wall biosynthesis
MPVRILALEPYYGGSHKAFLDDWSAASRHEFTLLTLPAYKWKWRMRHSAVTFSDDVRQRVAEGDIGDLIFCSDMLNLAEFLGLVPQPVHKLPCVLYFHENQLTYPVRFESERDYQFAMTNMTSALAAGKVWFNSAYHRDSFFDALAGFLGRMPDFQPTNAVEQIKGKSFVYPPGVNGIDRHEAREAGPLRILWAARWEHDKNPRDFFEALKILRSKGLEFRVSVIGEQFRQSPDAFEWARQFFADRIDRWGFQRTKAEYEKALIEADVFVSTAGHEFFGITAVEAILAGAYPMLPRRLAYPEILGLGKAERTEEFFYDGTVADLVEKLMVLAGRLKNGSLWGADTRRIVRRMERFKWDNVARVLDDAVDGVKSEFERK